MPRIAVTSLALLSSLSVSLVVAQQQCYYAAGAAYRAPAEANLVPCLESGNSACCRLGDTCLSGNTCYNYLTGDLYQYGCTDSTYTDPSCPRKCGFDPDKSPWTALEYCSGIDGIHDTWVCHAPESCGCQWNATYDLLSLTVRGCQNMGSEARVALYAPSALEPYVSLPSTYGGKTLYYSTTTISGTSTWVSTALKGYTPSSIGPLTTYSPAAPTTVIKLFPNESPGPASLPAAVSFNATVTPMPNGVWSGANAKATSGSTTTTNPRQTKANASGHTVTATGSAGLTTGAKAGIGVGVAVAVLAIAGLSAALFLLRRKRNNTAAGEGEHQFSEKSAAWQAPPPNSPPPERGYYDQYGYHGVPAEIYEAGGEETPASKLPPPPPMELDGGSGIVELSSREEVRGELESPPVGYKAPEVGSRFHEG